MSRLSRDAYFMSIAAAVAQRSTCLRRAVGCVLINERRHILATGYNGVAAGLPHCNELQPMSAVAEYPHACEAARAAPGTALDGCHAIHAEQNALLQCRDVFAVHACYVTTGPCVTCTKLLLGTSCQRIIAGSVYPASGAALWTSSGRVWETFSAPTSRSDP